ncbi:FAD-binding protein [Brevibacterium sp. 50QC2O2]|uniref:FAD-binding oxidoreductase n=1 Tax=unclassified Brevibacterium TaxID=2614124 RepID=UPI00211BE375|nr:MULTISPECIES: FAD-linked oxidase C-terminal domain-containing protein [unclassified Brevibacterium]MCQ9367759.1 FAD-binding protein [Brevibacterium sp. 91QC2O2]MCQ9388018.1 FAD-binding protein [Brevibacterium sp. 50QC2O2]
MPDISTLADLVGPQCLITDPDVMDRFLHDDAEWAPYETALAVLRPHDKQQVVAAVNWCIEHSVPIVPRGSGTGLSGGANAIAGCLVISFDRMQTILDVDPVERTATVQPGVVNDNLRARVADDGLWYPPDPASAPWSSIGGNVSTNAGGLCCVKYGVTSEYVLELELVNGLGELVRVGKRTAKDVAGYDFRGLYTGSEGTLGVIVEIKVRLVPLPTETRAIIGYFDSLVDAGQGVANVTAAGVIPAALELVDKYCLKAVDDWKNMGLSADAEVVLLASSDLPGEAGRAEAEKIVAAFESAGATMAAISEDKDEADAFFAARRLAYPALERLGPVLTEDVVVARSKVPEVLARIQEIGERNQVQLAQIAHAGDGNLHPLLVVPAGDDAARVRAQQAFEEILQAALDAGGTVSGEHGIGLLKMGGLSRELSAEVIAMHRAVKRALDPHNIMNPGKVFS